MASRAGYVFIESAIPSQLATEGANAIRKGLPVQDQREHVTEFVVPPVGKDIQHAFFKKEENIKKLSELVHPREVPQKVQSTTVGIFNESNADPKKPKRFRKDKDACVFVWIALADLNPDNGWFILLEGSTEATGDVALDASVAPSWPQISLDLKAGDAVAWRGSLAYLHSSGGGGMFKTIVLE